LDLCFFLLLFSFCFSTFFKIFFFSSLNNETNTKNKTKQISIQKRTSNQTSFLPFCSSSQKKRKWRKKKIHKKLFRSSSPFCDLRFLLSLQKRKYDIVCPPEFLHTIGLFFLYLFFFPLGGVCFIFLLILKQKDKEQKTEMNVMTENNCR